MLFRVARGVVKGRKNTPRYLSRCVASQQNVTERLEIASETSPSAIAVDTAEDVMVNDPEQTGALYVRQLALEEEAVERTVERYRAICENVIGLARGSALGPSQRLLARWFPAFVSAIDAEQASVVKKERGPDRLRYGPALLLLPPEKLAVISMHVVLNTLLREGAQCKVTSLSRAVGAAVAAEIGLSRLKSEGRRDWNKLQAPMSGRGAQMLRRRAHDALEGEWDSTLKIKVGAALVSLLVKSATVQVPAEAAPALAVRVWHGMQAAARPAVGARAHGRSISDKEREKASVDCAVSDRFERFAASHEYFLSRVGIHTYTPTTPSLRTTFENSTSAPSPPPSTPPLAIATAAGVDSRLSVAAVRFVENEEKQGKEGSEDASMEASMFREAGAIADDETNEEGEVEEVGEEEEGEEEDFREEDAFPATLLRILRGETDAMRRNLDIAAGLQARARWGRSDEESGLHVVMEEEEVEEEEEEEELGGRGGEDERSGAFPRAMERPGAGKAIGARWGQDSGVLLTDTERAVFQNLLVAVGFEDEEEEEDEGEEVGEDEEGEGDGRRKGRKGRRAGGRQEGEGEVVNNSSSVVRQWVELPALIHTYGRERGKTHGLIRLNPWILEGLESAIESHEHAKTLPMVVPPRDWTGPDAGAYLSHRIPIMRTHGSRLQQEVLREAHMPRMYQGLTLLGRVPWRINHFVLEAVEKLVAEGGGVAELPLMEDLPLPDEPVLAGLSEEEAREELWRWRRKRQRVLRGNADLHSLRCDLDLKLGVATRFADDVIYFPHNLDFRGRVYPIPPHLNHIGSDLCRGLLTFAEARPLGSRGYWWLKVHLANLFGVDKVSMDERAAFTEENIEKVIDSAARPLEGDRWWASAEHPLQALATCREIAAAIESGDPENFSSRLPVHQDGSCNGLQHYAALGRDAEGGRAVNLVKADKPQDVYSEVLHLVLERITQDAALPLPTSLSETERSRIEAARNAARLLRGHVDRKVIKQSVMTSVYGVTLIGAREQLLARLEEKFEVLPELPPGIRDADELDQKLWEAAGYLAKTTLDSIGTLFEAADGIKAWLTNAARTVAVAEQPMCWITPLGLPVVQPYRRTHAMVVQTALQGLSVADEDEQLPVSAQKQGSAFPPNYVHSLDSSHMLMTAIDCSRRGLTFTAVHDSYWTHARDIDVMNASLRDQFIRLYQLPLLEQLSSSLQLRFPGLEFEPLPGYGTLNLEDVRDSPYFFS